MQNVPTRVGLQGGPNVTGTLASLASNGHAYVSFDLGPCYDLYTLVQVTLSPVAPMTALNTVTVYGADAAALVAADLMAARVLGTPGATGITQAKVTNMTPATGAQSLWVRPMGRFVTVDFFNQDGTNAAGAASAINFAAYAGA